MFLAMAWGRSRAHLPSLHHAFFKGPAVLGSGAVIHALHGEQDIRNMEGSTDLPITYWTFVIGALAIAACWLSGFFSRTRFSTARSRRPHAL